MALLTGTCSVFTLQRPFSLHQKLYPGLCRHLSLQPLTKLKSPAKLRRKWLSASATVCFLCFSIPSIHGPTGLPSLPWAAKHFLLGRPTYSGSQDNALDSTLALTLYLYQNFSGLHPIPFCFGSALCCFGQETTH